MKTILIICISLACSICTFAQNKVVDKLFEEYAGQEGYTSVVITKHMFALFSDIETSEDDEYMNMIKNLNNIKILNAPGSAVSGVNFTEEVLSQLPKDQYEELMVIQDGDKDIKFLIKETDKRITELLMLVGGPEENVLICITGIIDMKAIAKLSKSMNIEGMENLDKIKDKFPS